MCAEKSAREEATSVFEQLKDVAYKVNSLRTITQRSMLTQEEMVCVGVNMVVVYITFSMCMLLYFCNSHFFILLKGVVIVTYMC